MMPRPPRSPLFPYTALFRSVGAQHLHRPRVTLAGEDPGDPVQHRDQVGDVPGGGAGHDRAESVLVDRKSTRLNSSHPNISYAVICLKKSIRILPDQCPMTTH